MRASETASWGFGKLNGNTQTNLPLGLKILHMRHVLVAWSMEPCTKHIVTVVQNEEGAQAVADVGAEYKTVYNERRRRT